MGPQTGVKVTGCIKNEPLCFLYDSGPIKATEILFNGKIEVILLFVLHTKGTLSDAWLQRFTQNSLVH